MFAACLVSTVLMAGANRLPAGHPLRVRALVDVPRGGQWSLWVGLRGERFRANGDFPTVRSAVARLERRTADRPDDAEAWDELADLLPTVGRSAAAARDRAVAARRAAVAAAPAAPAARTALAVALAQAGNQTDAVAEARKATELAPDGYPGWYGLAWAQSQAGDRAGAAAALAEARKRLPADPDERLQLAGLAVTLAVAGKGADRKAAEAALAEADAAIRAAMNTPAAAAAAERRLAVLMFRDMLGATVYGADTGPAFGADTLDLVRQLVPADGTDPQVPFTALMCEVIAHSGTAPANGPDAQRRLRAAVAPYRQALARIGRSADRTAAGTARFFAAYATQIVDDRTAESAAAAAADLRAAVRLVPSFDMAWSLLAHHDREAGRDARPVIREWVAASGSPLSRYILAREHVDRGDWAAAERVIDDGFVTPPALVIRLAGQPDRGPDLNGDPRLALCKAACLLRKGPAGVADGLRLLAAVAGSPEYKQCEEWDVNAHTARLAALGRLLADDRKNGLEAAEMYLQWAARAEEDVQADAKRVRALFDR